MSAILAFALANWRWAVPVALLLVVSVDDGLHRVWLAECQMARAEDKTAAEKAKSAALEAAKAKSDAIITEQAERLAETAAKAQTVTERIIRVPVTTACAGSPAVRDALGSLPDFIRPGGGQTPAGGGASPPVR